MTYHVTHPRERERLTQVEAEARQDIVRCWIETARQRRERQEQELRAARVSLWGPYKEDQDND